MAQQKVIDVLRNDRWTMVEGTTGYAPFLLRYRTPVLRPPDTAGYDRVLKIVWTYGDAHTGEMPRREDSEQMAEFENRFCCAVECDAGAILTAVLTFDGARQWVFYTGDVKECGRRLNSMPQNKEPYPLELTTELDPSWEYLHDAILKRVSVGQP